MKIAILTDGIYPFVIGGMQKHSFYLTKFLVGLGAEVTLVHCVHSKELPERTDVLQAMGLDEDCNLEVICLPFPDGGKLPGHYLKSNYFLSQNIYQKLKDRIHSFDFIYAKGFTSWVLADLKRKGADLPPLGVKFHGYEMFQPPASLRARFEQWLLRGPVKFIHEHTDYVFSYGGKISDIIRKIGVADTKIIEIPTGIANDWCRTNLTHTEGKRKFVFIGRYERRKGIEELTQSIAQLNKADYTFEFIGPIPATKKIKADNIVYHGKVMETEKIQAIIDNCHVLVTPSHSEGMPNVIMEGMARGLAIVATDVGAVAQQVDHSNGWLIEPNNMDELTSTLQKAIAIDNNKLDILRKQSIEKIKQHFTWEIVSKHTLQEISDRIETK